MAYFGVAINLGTVVLTSYCFLIHSRQQSGEAQSTGKELHVIIEREVEPILQDIGTLLNKCTENRSLKACQGVNFEEMKMQLKERKDKIEGVIKEINTLRDQSIEREEQSKVLKTGASVVSVIGAIAAPSVIPSFLLGVSLAVCCLGAGTLGYTHFETKKDNYRKTLQLLEKMEDRAFEAKKAITKLGTDLEIARRNGFGSPF